jgi:alkylated DNA repair dioxygenase AlkB
MQAVSQLGFFDADSRTIVDDESGMICYHARALDRSHADALFDALTSKIAWRSERRVMYERDVEVPRMVASLSIGSGVPAPLAEIVPLVERLAQARFNRIGLNLYRDGRDSVAPHNDTLRELEPGQPIALLSLGAVRRMTIRSKAAPRRAYDLDLEPGSVLIMSYRTQETYDHAVPKTGAAVGPRISAAFRVRRLC